MSGEREYVVLEHWDAYIEVVVTASSKGAAVERAKEVLAGASRDDDELTCPLFGNPTGKFEVRRVGTPSLGSCAATEVSDSGVAR